MHNDGATLIERLIAEQRSLTAVEKFAVADLPDTASRYRDLLPATEPVPGEQYAFEVDLDKCSGCKACVVACHALNGLDDDEAWRQTGTLTSPDWREPYQQTITTACHHCVDPGCLNGCPVLAYDKDPITGIVRHLDDQCIGCQYCIWKCPYEVPQYSATRGIVRKCDMCSHRLAVGEAPACVQACPSEAIRITVVRGEELVSQYRSDSTPFLPAAPEPGITVPSTRYITARGFPKSVSAADETAFHKQPANFSLVILLVFSQLATGIYLFGARPAVALGALVIAIGASVFHLGRPFAAWRVFLGLRRSWLSREAIALGGFLFAGALFLKPLAICMGLLAVFCSAMVYHDTRREFWHLSRTGPKFFGTMLLLGSSFALLSNPAFAIAVIAFALGKLAVENRIFQIPSLSKTAFAHHTIFALQHRVRIACLFAGGVLFPALILADNVSPAGWNPDSSLRSGWFASAGFLFCLAGELIERWLFFVAVQSRKMPGDLA